MAEGKGALPNRNVVLAAGAFTALGTGLIYMWSIFNKPLIDAYGFSTSEVALAYSLYLLATCFSSMLAGWLQQRVQPRFVVLGGGILVGVGWFGSGLANTLPLLYLFFSLFAGAGNGFLYNTIVSVVTRWFPDKRGFANGICIGAIGFSPVIFAPIGNWLIEEFSVQMAFHIVGVVWLVVYLLLSWLLLTPPEGWSPEGAQLEEAAGQAAADDYDVRSLFKDPLYYLVFLVMMVASTSGLMITGHASSIGQELAGLTASEGAIMVSVLAFGSFVGRFFFGSLSDRIGRYPTLMIALACNAVIMCFAMPAADSFVTFLCSVAAVGAFFGATMSVVPAIVGDVFGSEHFGQNYSFVYPGYTVASFIGPMAAAFAVEQAGTYVPAFYIAGALSIAGFFLVLACRALRKG